MQNAKNEAKKTVWQFIKFSAVGVTNTLVDFIVFWLLTHAGMNYMLSQVFSYSAGILNSYIWNSKWTFKAISISSDLICKIPASVFSAVANFVLTKLFVFNKETHPEENGGN